MFQPLPHSACYHSYKSAMRKCNYRAELMCVECRAFSRGNVPKLHIGCPEMPRKPGEARCRSIVSKKNSGRDTPCPAIGVSPGSLQECIYHVLFRLVQLPRRNGRCCI
jgi:hypothetical protein